jgi:hypothetical protein
MRNVPSKKHASFPGLLVILTLAGLAIITFGVWAPKLGLYWDDWAKLLVNRLWGPEGYWAYYAEDRPLSAWTHILLTPIFGESPLPWQIFAVLMRFLSALGFWWLLRGLWPAARRQVAMASMLFLVYPVFNQQAIAVTFHQQWLQYALITFSLALMVQAFRQPRHWIVLTIASLLTAILQLSITEYFVGLELIRLPIFWILTLEQESTWVLRIKKTLLRWLPYLLLLGAFIIWRLFFIQLTGDDPYKANWLYRLTTTPLPAILDLAKWIGTDTLYVLLACWGKVIEMDLSLSLTKSTLFTWLIAFVTGLAVMLILCRLQRIGKPDRKTWIWQALLLGLYAVLVGCLQAWVTERRIIEDFHANRYAMPAMLGAALIWTALVEWIGRSKLQKAVMMGAMIGLALIFHWNTARDFATIWQNQVDFYWQLSWRAPALSPKTAILSEEELFPNQGSFSTAAAINLMYPQDDTSSETLDYWVYPMNPRFKNNYAYEQPFNLPLKTRFRTLAFEGQTPDTIIVYYNPQRADCLWLLSEADIKNPLLAELTRQMLPISNLERVQAGPANAAYPPIDMIGAEPEHEFCYLYQKAALTLQEQDTAAALALAENAWQLYPPSDEAFKTPHEWLTFIRAYAAAERWQDAADLTLEVSAIRPGEYYRYLCAVWDQLEETSSTSPDKTSALAAVRDQLTCAAFP